MRTPVAKNRYLLWLGAVLEESEACKKPAISLAANRWQQGLLQALCEQNIRVRVHGHVLEPAWPHGPFHVKESNLSLSGLSNMQLCDYLNLPNLRELWILRRLRKNMARTMAEHGPPAAILSYNLSYQNAMVALGYQNTRNIPWVPVLADGPGSVLEKHHQERWLQQATGRIFLSWARYETCNELPKFHLDAGITSFRPIQQTAPEKTILYSGAMTHYAGIDLLVQAFQKIDDPYARLWICGKGNTSSIAQIAAKDSRIKIFGVVSEEKLNELSVLATAFVNPRPTNLEDSLHNFPSKIVEYLSYGKPVISSWTPGIAPEYRDVLIIVEPLTPQNLAKIIEDVLSWGSPRRNDLQTRIEEFVKSKKLWSVQASRLVKWLNSEVLRVDSLS
ncbi:MAG: glycosyltransferase [Pseudomonadota bacterium]